MLKSKIHRATVTDANLDYIGSITIDKTLMDAVDIIPFEKVDVYNITNGSRLTTYAIEGAAGSGVICTNGAAAHLTGKGDLVIIVSYASFDETELSDFKPRIIVVDSKNRIRHEKKG